MRRGIIHGRKKIGTVILQWLMRVRRRSVTIDASEELMTGGVTTATDARGEDGRTGSVRENADIKTESETIPEDAKTGREKRGGREKISIWSGRGEMSVIDVVPGVSETEKSEPSLLFELYDYFANFVCL